MKFILNHRWLRPDERLTAQVKQKLSRLARLVRIETAEIVLERKPHSVPPYTAKVRLAVPGPDIYSEERHYTLEASIRSALDKLSRQLRHRKQRAVSRRRSELQECVT